MRQTMQSTCYPWYLGDPFHKQHMSQTSEDKISASYPQPWWGVKQRQHTHRAWPVCRTGKALPRSPNAIVGHQGGRWRRQQAQGCTLKACGWHGLGFTDNLGEEGQVDDAPGHLKADFPGTSQLYTREPGGTYAHTHPSPANQHRREGLDSPCPPPLQRWACTTRLNSGLPRSPPKPGRALFGFLR